MERERKRATFSGKAIEPIINAQRILNVQFVPRAAGRLMMKAVGLLVLAVALLAGAGIIYRSLILRQREKQLSIRDASGIDEAFFVAVRGTQQWITIRGRKRSNPVLMMIHGGPGVSNGAFAVDLLPYETDFTVVQWDQPGAAKSSVRAGRTTDPNLTMAGVTQDGIGVAEFLKAHLHRNKIILLGWSWGSIIGVEMVRKRPDLFAAYVGTGQIVNEQAGEAISYSRVLERAYAARDEQAVRELEAGPPPYSRQAELGTQRKWSSIYAGDSTPIVEIVRLAVFAPRYSLGDIWGYLTGVVASQNHFIGVNMEGEFTKVDLMAGNIVFAVPIFIIQGTEDVWTPADLSRVFVARLTAPEKAFIPIEGAGHAALVRNASAFLKAMNSRVRPIGIQQSIGSR
jgi:pimeloyl-ACP methyl ester carboxylesterase